jgi:hypothetical protein
MPQTRSFATVAFRRRRLTASPPSLSDADSQLRRRRSLTPTGSVAAVALHKTQTHFSAAASGSARTGKPRTAAFRVAERGSLATSEHRSHRQGGGTCVSPEHSSAQSDEVAVRAALSWNRRVSTEWTKATCSGVRWVGGQWLHTDGIGCGDPHLVRSPRERRGEAMPHEERRGTEGAAEEESPASRDGVRGALTRHARRSTPDGAQRSALDAQLPTALPSMGCPGLSCGASAVIASSSQRFM